MVDTRIIIFGLWVATMLIYLLGDVLRIYAGDVEPGEIMDTRPTPGVWLFMAAIMLIPIVMAVLTLTLPYPAIRWTNIVVAISMIVFNLLGLPYKGAYDNFLIAVSFVLFTQSGHSQLSCSVLRFSSTGGFASGKPIN
jgi:hypothetical protein